MSDPIFTFTSINPFGLSNVGGFANPTFGDIDGDGDLDAYVGSDNRLGGYNSTGKILFFENTGTTDNPVFAPYSIVPFRGTFSLASYPAPTLVDIDGDGDLDAFVGWKNGNIELNRNTGTSNSPDFNLDYDDSWGTFGLSNVGGRASPTFADIDGDGDLDAFVGNQNGDILFFTNTASVGTHVPEPAIPDDNILVTALNLSARAYSDAHHDDQSVINAVNKHIKNWKPLEATDLGFSATDSRFSKVGGEVGGDLLRYDYFHASATVGLTMLDGKLTLGIAFEGTNSPLSVDSLLDLVSDVSYIKGYYNLLTDSNFNQSVVAYINANNIEQVLVTGHSLGGATAQSFMHDYGQHDTKYIGVTFGSPGTLQLQPLPKDRFVNIQHNGDPVVNASQYITHQNIVHGAIINADVEDPGLDGLLREHTLYTPLDNSKISYRETVEFITSQLDAKTLFQDMSIVPGTNNDDNLSDRTGHKGEILLGGNGADTMTGGLDSQVFMGGGDNDIIDGSFGVDTAIYTAPISSYVMTKLDQKFFLADQRTEPNNEGTDTLDSIERIIFTDFALALDVSGSAGMVAKLIGAVFGAGSVANTSYVAIGLSYLDNGTSYADLAALAIDAAGAKSPEQITSLLWNNVVGSAPTADQILPYIMDMKNGVTTVGTLGVLAADTSINQENIDLVGLKNRGITYDLPDSSW